MNRKQRRAFCKIHKHEIREEVTRANERKEDFEANSFMKILFKCFGKIFFFMRNPSPSVFGFYLNEKLGMARELFGIKFLFKSYSIGVINYEQK